MTFFNEYSLTVTGIMLEIFGAFMLTLEAYGSKWLEKPIKKFVQFSNWTGSSFIASIIISLITIIPFIAAGFLGNKICQTLLLPALILGLIIPTLFDDAEKLEKWASITFNDKKIGPKGFLLILIGSILQLISTIIQIK
ncbi:hypothetical protein M9Q43_05615 [Flavobacterium sp. HXWNR29]|uniref:hypothetical protein n=1 Tax=Flavobacterium odoriferum TaxID=2946604 RepID=UPI0021CAF478|nr:hypothetical protein [Flavobacterium sp. HXWNR29]MCU4188641.1 hypothetical protein [Flavobacterium sp. HXWNR29]